MNEELPWDSVCQVRNIYNISNILPAPHFSPSFSSLRDSGGSGREFSSLFPVPAALLCMSRAVLLSALALGSAFFSRNVGIKYYLFSLILRIYQGKMIF